MSRTEIPVVAGVLAAHCADLRKDGGQPCGLRGAAQRGAAGKRK